MKVTIKKSMLKEAIKKAILKQSIGPLPFTSKKPVVKQRVNPQSVRDRAVKVMKGRNIVDKLFNMIKKSVPGLTVQSLKSAMQRIASQGRAFRPHGVNENKNRQNEDEQEGQKLNTCQQCGQKFPGQGPNDRYCSKQCARRRRRVD